MKLVEIQSKLLDDSNKTSLQTLLNALLVIAIERKDSDLQHWIKLELHGYYTENPELKEEDYVPEYRTVVGQHYDMYGRPLVLKDPDIHFVNSSRLRNPVSELEEFAKKDGELSFSDPHAIKMIRESLNIEVSSFVFPRSMVHTILASIRTKMLERIIELKRNEVSFFSNAGESEFGLLHPEVNRTSKKLYIDGHYREAVLNAAISLIHYMKIKSGRHDLDGTQLATQIFSPKNPKVVVSENFDEQMGFMWLYQGAIMALRNTMAHSLEHDLDQQKTYEWLSFLSVLFRSLDKSRVRTEE